MDGRCEDMTWFGNGAHLWYSGLLSARLKAGPRVTPAVQSRGSSPIYTHFKNSELSTEAHFT
jgi:hypothetical protein